MRGETERRCGQACCVHWCASTPQDHNGRDGENRKKCVGGGGEGERGGVGGEVGGEGISIGLDDRAQNKPFNEGRQSGHLLFCFSRGLVCLK